MRFRHDHLRLTLPDDLARQGLQPLEQGGILIGQGSTVTRFTTPGPLDLCLPSLFMLLDPSHEDTLAHSGQSYLGFWHTHPAGTPSEPSEEDLVDWHAGAALMFAQVPHDHLYYPIVTGDRLRVWALDRQLTLTELRREVEP